MAGSRTSSSLLHSVPRRSYDNGLPNVEFGQLVGSLALRGLIVGAAGALVYLAGRSMIHDLLEEVKAGLV